MLLTNNIIKIIQYTVTVYHYQIQHLLDKRASLAWVKLFVLDQIKCINYCTSVINYSVN